MHEEENVILMQTMPSQVGPTFTEVGLSDCTEAGTDQCVEEYDKSENTPPLSTTKWEKRNGLCEPLLLEENEHNIL